MKLDELVNFVEKFILDVIGVILPGVILLVGLATTLSPQSLEQQWAWPQLSSTGKCVVLICLAYVAGHGLHVLGEKLLLPIFAYFPKLGIRTPKGSSDHLQKSSAFSSFTKVFEKIYRGVISDDQDKIDFYAIRSLAMSVAPDVEPLTYKFMFISLMNVGVATAVFITGIAFVVNHFGMVHVSILRFTATTISLLIVIPYVFLLKYSEFYRRGLGVPFPTATVKLLKEANEQSSPSRSGSSSPTVLSTSAGGPVVYLAGGFVSGWQDIAMAACPGANYFDPRAHGLVDPSAYTAWDLQAIRDSDVVFAVLERTNPGGYALALELGYAKSRGKYVIFVDEKSSIDPSLRGYLAMLHSVSDETYDSFEAGVIALARILLVLDSG